MVKVNSINLFITVLITISLVSASSLGLVLLPNKDNQVSAQVEYHDNSYYDNYNYNDNINDYYHQESKDKKEKKEPPMLLVKKELLFCDSIAFEDNDGISCNRPNSDLFVGPDSDRYIKGCNSEQCEGITPSTFDIKITDDIKFDGSDKGTKVNFKNEAERFTVIEESSKTESSSFQLENIDTICRFSGFDSGIIGSFDNNNGEANEFASCVIFEGDCTGFVQDRKQKECTVKNHIVVIEEEEEVTNVIITWREDLSGNEEIFEIFAAMSMDSGATFGPGFNVSETDTDSGARDPQVAMSGDNAVIIWREDLPGNPETFAAMSMDGGATFGPGFNVSDTSTESDFPQVAMSGDNTVITWEEDLSGNLETFAAMSMDGGATFGPGFNVSETDTDSFSQRVVISDDNAVIIWTEDLPGNADIFAARSIDGGATFGPGFNVSETDTDSFGLQIAMSDDNAVIIWREALPGNDDIFAAMSMDGGATFGPGFNVSDTGTGSFFAQVAMSGDNVVITWREDLPGFPEIFAAMSMDGGATFGPGFNVSDTSTFSTFPQIAMSGDNVVITWQEFISDNNEIFAAMSMDGGATFGTGFNVSETDTESSRPQIAMSGDNVVITWQEDLPGNPEIFAAMSMDGGATFGTGFNVSETDTDSSRPQIAIN